MTQSACLRLNIVGNNPARNCASELLSCQRNESGAAEISALAHELVELGVLRVEAIGYLGDVRVHDSPDLDHTGATPLGGRTTHARFPSSCMSRVHCIDAKDGALSNRGEHRRRKGVSHQRTRFDPIRNLASGRVLL